MKLFQALKEKNRIAGELAQKWDILRRENARRSDSVSKVDRNKIYQEILVLSDKLGNLKAKITTANIGIYPKLERMAELKSHVAQLQSLPKRDGEELVPLHGDQPPLKYTWDSFINQELCDVSVSEYQKKIAALQDEVDQFNAVTSIED